ncbi:hypothetical protein C8R43DRAFT_1151646 [Mycena crocata]|nr:hypothetical protein C8R43DRAFT_1151646 [Mycena crocata]
MPSLPAIPPSPSSRCSAPPSLIHFPFSYVSLLHSSTQALHYGTHGRTRKRRKNLTLIHTPTRRRPLHTADIHCVPRFGTRTSDGNACHSTRVKYQHERNTNPATSAKSASAQPALAPACRDSLPFGTLAPGRWMVTRPPARATFLLPKVESALRVARTGDFESRSSSRSAQDHGADSTRSSRSARAP